jgi:hypothetical protein
VSRLSGAPLDNSYSSVDKSSRDGIPASDVVTSFPWYPEGTYPGDGLQLMDMDQYIYPDASAGKRYAEVIVGVLTIVPVHGHACVCPSWCILVSASIASSWHDESIGRTSDGTWKSYTSNFPDSMMRRKRVLERKVKSSMPESVINRLCVT